MEGYANIFLWNSIEFLIYEVGTVALTFIYVFKNRKPPLWEGVLNLATFTLKVIFGFFFFWFKMADGSSSFFSNKWRHHYITTTVKDFSCVRKLLDQLSVTLLFISIFLFMRETWILPINLKVWPHNDAKLRHCVNQVCLDVWNDEYIILCKFIQFNWIQFISLNIPWLTLSYRQRFSRWPQQH